MGELVSITKEKLYNEIYAQVPNLDSEEAGLDDNILLYICNFLNVNELERFKEYVISQERGD